MSDNAQKFPGWRYKQGEKPVIVQSAEEDQALGSGWSDSPEPTAKPDSHDQRDVRPSKADPFAGQSAPFTPKPSVPDGDSHKSAFEAFKPAPVADPKPAPKTDAPKFDKSDKK